MLKTFSTQTVSRLNATDLKNSALERNLKEYEALQLEAARLERDAKRVHMENAVFEQVRCSDKYPTLIVTMAIVLWSLSGPT